MPSDVRISLVVSLKSPHTSSIFVEFGVGWLDNASMSPEPIATNSASPKTSSSACLIFFSFSGVTRR